MPRDTAKRRLSPRSVVTILPTRRASLPPRSSQVPVVFHPRRLSNPTTGHNRSSSFVLHFRISFTLVMLVASSTSTFSANDTELIVAASAMLDSAQTLSDEKGHYATHSDNTITFTPSGTGAPARIDRKSHFFSEPTPVQLPSAPLANSATLNANLASTSARPPLPSHTHNSIQDGPSSPSFAYQSQPQLHSPAGTARPPPLPRIQADASLTPTSVRPPVRDSSHLIVTPSAIFGTIVPPTSMSTPFFAKEPTMAETVSTDSASHNTAIPLTFSATRTPLPMASSPSPNSVTTSKSLTPSNGTNPSDMVFFFRQRSAHLSSPIFRRPSKLSRDLTSPVFRVNPLAATVAAAACLPPSVSPILIANLQFSLISAFDNLPFTVDLGSRAAGVPLPYAIYLSLCDTNGSLRPISVRLERILDPRPTLFIGVISGDVDLLSDSDLKSNPTSLQCVLAQNTLTFWAAPDFFEPNGFARLLLTVTDHDYNDYEIPIDIKATPVSPNISVEAPGYPHRQIRTETNLTFKEHEKESDVLITVWNETENNSPLLVNAVVEESCGGAFSIGKSYKDSEKCVPLLMERGNSCTFYARFEMKPELTVRKCYYGSVLIKYAVALPGEGAPGQDQELHQFYDHVLNLRADGAGVPHEDQPSPDWNGLDTSRRILEDDDCVCSDVEEHGDRACILFEDHESPERVPNFVCSPSFGPASNSGVSFQNSHISTTTVQTAVQESQQQHSDESNLDIEGEARVAKASSGRPTAELGANNSSPTMMVDEQHVSSPVESICHVHMEHSDNTPLKKVTDLLDDEKLPGLDENPEMVDGTHPIHPVVPQIEASAEDMFSCDMPMIVDVSTAVEERFDAPFVEDLGDLHEGPRGPNSLEGKAETATNYEFRSDDISCPQASDIELTVHPIPSKACLTVGRAENEHPIDSDGDHYDAIDCNNPILSIVGEGDSRFDVSVQLQETSIQLTASEGTDLVSKHPGEGLGYKATESPSHVLDETQNSTVPSNVWNDEWKINNNARHGEIIALSHQNITDQLSHAKDLDGPGASKDVTMQSHFENGSETLAIKRPKLKMPRRIRENGIVMDAKSGTVEFPVLNASSEVVEVSIFMERNGDDGAGCYVSVTPNYVVLAAQGKAILTMTRTSGLGGEHHILLRGSSLGSQQRKRTYRIPVHVVPSAMRLESNEEFSVDRPTMSFYNPESEGRQWNIRIRNGTKCATSYTAWIGQGCGELLNSDGDPAFRIIGTANGLIEPERFANVQVEFVGGKGVQHFHGRLYFDVGKQQDFIPLFGYVGGSDLRLMSNELGYVIARNVGERAGFIVLAGPECDPVHNQSVRAVLAPKEEREFVAPYGTGSVVYTGDEIARTRACRAEEIERMRADKTFDNSSCDVDGNIFEGEFDGEDAAMQAEMLNWAGEDRFSMFYSGRLFDYTVHRYMFDLNNEEKVDFIETSRAGRNGWSAVSKDGFVHIENLNVAKELCFEAVGAEPCRGVIAAFGDALLAPFREVVEIRAQGKTQTVTVKLQDQE